MSIDSSEEDPNIFRNLYISEEAVAARMAAIVRRPMYLPLSSHTSLGATIIPMSEFQEYEPSLDQDVLHRLIRNLMVGPRIRQCIDRAHKTVIVYEKHTPVGAALLEHVSGNEWIEYRDEPKVDVLSFGAITNAHGAVNQYVLERLAREIVACAEDLSDSLHPFFAKRGMGEFVPTVSLNASSGIPTILAAVFNKRLARVMGNLHSISEASTANGTGFPAKVSGLNDGLAELQKHDVDHALTRAFADVHPLKMLDYNRIAMGGDLTTYESMKKTAAVMHKLMTALLHGMDEAFLQLYPATLPVPASKIDVHEDSEGAITVEVHHGVSSSSMAFIPRPGAEPLIRFDHTYPEATSDLCAAFLKKVVGGVWWGEQMAARS